MRSNVHYDAEDLWTKDRDHVVHGWADFATFHETGSEILVEGDGAHVWDVHGNKLIDGIGGVWCVNVGYGREEIVDAMAEQARRLPYANPFHSTSTAPAAELAAKLVELAPDHIDHVFYTTGGSTANDTAFRIVEHYFNHLGQPGRKHIISRTNAYHGSTSVSAALSGLDFNKIGFDTPEQNIHYVSATYIYRRPSGMTVDDFCDHLVQEFEDKVEEVGPERIAAFFAEPIMGMGGVVDPPEGYFRRISEICKRHGILIIADEVVTGFCRLGEFFASDAIFEMAPDIITCAKGLTSGYVPLGAALLSRGIWEVIGKPIQAGAMFTHGFTYSGHPVCCAAALANIAVMEKIDLCGHVNDMGGYFEEGIRSLLDLPTVGDVRGRKFMIGIESVADKETGELLPFEADVGHRTSHHARELGLILRPLAHLNILSPCLILNRAEVDTIVEILRESITRTQDDLVREGLWKG